MTEYDNRIVRGTAAGYAETMDMGLRAHMLRVYNYMVGALALTGVVAYVVANSPALLNMLYQQGANGALAPTMLGWVVMLAPIGLVFFLSFRVMQMSQSAAQATFWVYAALTGASLSSILIAYTGASVAMTFFVTAGTFGAMSLYGYTTKRDLSGLGSFLMMGLIGLLLASLANMFFQSSAMNFVISVVGVLIFTGLTAWDTQKIKNSYFHVSGTGAIQHAAIMGAVTLYLDFINLFQFLLAFLGQRRE